MIHAEVQLNRPSGFSLDVSLEMGTGVTALYGPSGAGKTTVLKLIAGLERGKGGDRIRVRNDGETWQDEAHFVPPHRRGIGYVPQGASLFPHLSVRDNLEFGQRRSRRAVPDPSQVHEWLELAPLLDKHTGELSGGEAQRVAIGRALLTGARCILMDEPLGAIDQSARNRILPSLDRLHHELDATLVYVSHSLEEVTYLADHLYVIDAGRITANGSVAAMSTSLELAAGQGETLAAVLECKVAGFDVEFGLAQLDFGNASLYVATSSKPTGTSCRVRIPARDVSIALEAPTRTSILNIIPATVEEIHATDGPSVLVKLAVAGQFIMARITRKSLTALGLQKSQPVFAQIKGVALLTEHV